MKSDKNIVKKKFLFSNNGLKFISFLLIVTLTRCGYKNISTTEEFPSKVISKVSLRHINKQLSKLVPVTLDHDISYLPPAEQEVTDLLIRASDYMNRAFLKQVYEDNELLLAELETYKGGKNKPYYDYFKIMAGPWDRLDQDKPFINTMLKSAGAGFYPADMTPEAFKAWLKAHPEDEKAFKDAFTIIRRERGKLSAVPYSEYFKDLLDPVADLLRQAAEKTSDPSLATFLKSRAHALLSNDYRRSDIDWIALSGDIEVVIGPYEVYEDCLFGYKAAFESFVCMVDKEETQKLESVASFQNDLTGNLPVPEGYEIFPKGLSSPIKVVNQIYASGLAAALVPTAFNLPNDERIKSDNGSKNVLLKNVMKAKFDKILVPISHKVLAEKDRTRVSFEGYFNYVLMHEISHGLAPGNITVNGRETTVKSELRELYSTLDECQADTLGVYNAQFLIDAANSPMSEGLEETLYASNLASMFRLIRFGITSAHGGGVAIQLNYYLKKGAVKVDENGLFFLDDEKIRDAVRELAQKVLMIELTGNYDAARKLVDKYCYISEDVAAALDKISDIPIDIRLTYPAR
ncbi:dipeptidyl-peptidase 3 family protein [Desulfonema magnum]|uniref:Peptidase, M49 family n=1 Tax=Desulfonema magnum TaxID=45655 RepID=A0A975BS88_9BACT|nr:hypothetical protein [Desulfonema magnum]QTA90696.1 Peptidase, M49 family [Desulfonema magnum]